MAADDVSYVEAHGTGTSLGDPIEVQALARVIGPRSGAPLRIGSVKTNIGHLEPAAGIAGLIKVVLSLRHQTLPPHLHFRRPSPHIAWDSTPIEVVTSREPWQAANGRRIAGVSSFGLSGVNAHVVVEEAPAASRHAAATAKGADRPLHILTISGYTPPRFSEQVARYQAYLADADKTAPWADICFTATTGRRHFPHRVAIVAGSIADARARLAAVATELELELEKPES